MPLYQASDNFFASQSLATGEPTVPRHLSTLATIAMTTQVMRLTYFTAQKSETVTQVRVATGGTAAATITLIRFGIYSVDAAGALTLIASTPNDATLLAATNTEYTKALSASWAKSAGLRYAFATLVVATTQPTLLGGSVALSAVAGRAPRISGLLSGQTDLPAGPVADASLTNSVSFQYAELLQ